MNSIPTQKESPKGLHQRYYIQKIIPNPAAGQVSHTSPYGKEFFEPNFISQECDKGSEYFVLRLDDNGMDPKHIAACRIGVNAYADAIKDHLPELAKDLKERYPLPLPSKVEEEQWVNACDETPELPGNYVIRVNGEIRERYFDGSDIHRQVWFEAAVQWKRLPPKQ